MEMLGKMLLRASYERFSKIFYRTPLLWSDSEFDSRFVYERFLSYHFCSARIEALYRPSKSGNSERYGGRAVHLWLYIKSFRITSAKRKPSSRH